VEKNVFLKNMGATPPCEWIRQKSGSRNCQIYGPADSIPEQPISLPLAAITLALQEPRQQASKLE